jgi:hypothetical protein
MNKKREQSGGSLVTKMPRQHQLPFRYYVFNLAINSPGLSATPCQGPPNQLGGTSRTLIALFLVQLKILSMTMRREIRTPSKVDLETRHTYQDYHHHMGWRPFMRRSPFEHCRPSFKKNSQYCNVPTSCKELPLSGPYIGLLNRDALFHRI